MGGVTSNLCKHQDPEDFCKQSLETIQHSYETAAWFLTYVLVTAFRELSHTWALFERLSSSSAITSVGVYVEGEHLRKYQGDGAKLGMFPWQ